MEKNDKTMVKNKQTKSHKLLPMNQWKYFAQILDGELIVLSVQK